MNVDVLVFGGGPAGAATALAARRRGLSVVVVERSAPIEVRVGEHLSPSTLPLLDRLGILGGVLAGQHRRSAGVRSAWGEAELRDRDYLFSAEGEGFHLTRAGFDAMLLGCAEAAGALVLRGRAAPPERGDGGWVARVESQEIRASVVIDATGRAAWLARAQGARRQARDRLVGITAFLEPRAGVRLEDTLWIESVASGWLYTAPLAGDRLVLTAFTDADGFSGAGDAAGCARACLAEGIHTSARIAPFAWPAAWHVRAACSEITEPVAGPDWLAVGDAATARDPLSSSGIAHALEDALAAAAAVEAHLGGDQEAFRRYAGERAREFGAYFETRTRYYRMERRFAGSRFWRRRWWPEPEDAPVTLDPRTRLRPAPRALERARRVAGLPAGVDVDVLCGQASAPAHVLVAAHRAAHPGGASDRAVIAALQALIDAGLFEPGDPPAARP